MKLRGCAAVFHGSCISEQVKWETDKGRHNRSNRHKEQKKYNIVTKKEIAGKSKNHRSEKEKRNEE